MKEFGVHWRFIFMTIGEGQPRDNMGSAGVHRFGFALQLFLAVGLPINLRRSLVQSRHIFSARSKIIRRPLWCRVREEGSLIRTDPENIVQLLGGNEAVVGYRSTLDEDGAVRIPGLISVDEALRLRRASERIILEASDQGVLVGAGGVIGATEAEGDSGRFLQYTLQGAQRRNSEFLNFIRNSPASDLASALLDSPGKPVAFHADDLFIKEAKCPERTAWHRDIYTKAFSPSPGAPVNGDSGERMVNIWVALGDIKVWNSIRILKGSHAWQPGTLGTPEIERLVRTFFGPRWREELGAMLPAVQDMDEEKTNGLVVSFAIELIEEYLGEEEFEKLFPVVAFDLKAGDAVVFHRQALHSARPNYFNEPRFALSTRWGTKAKKHMTEERRFEQ